MGFQLLGPVELVYAGKAVQVGRRQEKCLLCVLLLEAGRLVPTERLLDLLWNGEPPASGRSTLHTYVARLRRSLEPHGIPLVTKGGGYYVDVDPATVDVHRFTSGLGRAQQIADPAGRLAVLESALSLWRGQFMADVADDWLRERLGANLERGRLTALELRAEAMLGAGRLGEAADSLADLVRHRPDRERFVELLMLALAGSGRKAEALAAYRDLHRTLVDEHGIEPSSSIQSLHLKLLNDEPVVSVTAPVHVSSERRQFLPRETPDFIGRVNELDWLDRFAKDQENAGTVLISTIGGMGGVGKTALAVKWAHSAAGRYPDGQLYLDLRGYDRRHPLQPGEALTRLLRALGVAPHLIPSDVDEASDLYRSLVADLKVLVLLDNASSVAQVRPLLPSGKGNLVLVTSREQLTGLVARDGAKQLTLDTLSTDEAVGLLRQIIGDARVNAEPAAAVALAEVVGHLPLTLRVAAAHLGGNPRLLIADYVQSLVTDDRLSALGVEGDPASTIRVVFHHSYQVLTPEQQRLFGLLGLIPGPDFTEPAAAALADTEVAPMIAALANAHLTTEHKPGRFQMHDLVKLYAAEQVAADEERRAIGRLHEHYLMWTDAAARSIHPRMLRLPFEETLPALENGLAWLDDEYPNLLAAIHACAADDPLSWQLSDVLRGYLYNRRHMPEWLSAAETALANAQSTDEVAGQVMARISLAQAHWNQSERAEAVEILIPAVALAESLGWHDATAGILGNLGGIHCDWGRPLDAAKFLDDAVEVHRLHGTGSLVAANNLLNLGSVCHDLGQLDDAKEHYTEAIQLYDQVGAPVSIAYAQLFLGMTMLDSDDLPQAAEHLEAALPVFQQTRQPSNEAMARIELARLRLMLGDTAAASQLAQQALQTARELKNARPMAGALILLGTIEGSLSRHEEALRHAASTPFIKAQALLAQSQTLSQLGRNGEATIGIHEALDTARQESFRVLEGAALVRLAETQDDSLRARYYAVQAVEVLESTGANGVLRRARNLLT